MTISTPPPYEPEFLTETNERYWEDCLVISLLRICAFADPEIPVVNTEREWFERTGGHVGETPVLYPQWDRMTQQAFGHIGATPANFASLKIALTGDARAVIAGSMGNLTAHLKRWSPNSATNAGHAVNVGPYDPDTGLYWWVDPLGRGNYIGEWVAEADVKQFAWGAPYWRVTKYREWAPGVSPEGAVMAVNMQKIKKVRLFDSRPAGTNKVPPPIQIARLKAGVVAAVQIAGAGGIPADAYAVLGNLTCVNNAQGGFMDIGEGADGSTSTVNFVQSKDRPLPNFVVAFLDASGKLPMWSSTDTDVFFDAVAYLVP